MKKITGPVILAFFCFTCGHYTPSIQLIEGGKSTYHMVVASEADSLTQLASRELQTFFEQVADIKLPIFNSLQDTLGAIIVGHELIDSHALGLDTLKEDGFLIRVRENKLILAGASGKSTLYAVYTFLEEYLGCRMLADEEYYIPERSNVQIKEGSKVYEPDFQLRKLSLNANEYSRYKNWNKLEDLDEWGPFVHTFHQLIPPEKYYDAHPEYFSLVGGHRQKDGQLCLSNPATLRTLKENLGAWIKSDPEKKYWSVSQNDCFNYCECSDCQVLYDKYENISGAYVHMANEIAEAFPDKQISTLAYNFTRSAPKNIVPLENVNIMFCSIECNRSMPLEKDERSTDFVKDMKDWSAITDNIFAWDYTVQFKNFLTPFPNLYILQPNLQFFHDHGVRIMFEQGSGRDFSDLVELKQYLLAKLMWDKDADQEVIIEDFITKYYGDAAAEIKAYFDLTHRTLREFEKEERLDIYGYPSDYLDSYLKPEKLKTYKAIMDRAEAAVKEDSVYLKRVQRVRLAVDFAYLDIALNKSLGDISFVGTNGDSTYLRQDMLDYLDRFTEMSAYTGAIYVNERHFHTRDYRDYALGKLQRMTTPNLAKGKKIAVLTTYSENYPVGGGKALNDGVVGELDYHQKWLGFEGEDMIVQVDLEKSQLISQVSMNFLKAINSWTFLPLEVVVEGSEDGAHFSELGRVKTTDTDRGFLVRSIPYVLPFEPVKTRYLRVTATSGKACPDWHRGYGKPSWIFIDELIIE